MHIGHISLAPPLDSDGAAFVRLVEALQEAGIRQHALVRDAGLARRLNAIAGVTVGSVVHSPIMAYCLLPRVDVLHVHEPAAGQAGLLSALTRSIPYVLTHQGTVPRGSGPVLQAVYRRASVVICRDDSEVAMLRHWMPGLTADIIPDIDCQGSAGRHLRIYQNSQRTPIAGNSGIQ